MTESLHISATKLLKDLIEIKSFSGEERLRSDYLERFFCDKEVSVERVDNNLVIHHKMHRADKPTLMLNSHIDTVRPATGYSFNPFNPPKSDTHIYGLGSNDAGGSVASMIMAFLHFKYIELPINVILALSAEEENSGPKGMRKLWKKLENEVDMAIVGEPTGMKAAVGERGLLVIDGVAKGVSGHAARDEGVNALYIALDDIATLRKTDFDKISPTMGKVKLTVTQIDAGSQHNVVPDLCKFVVDIRPTEQYTNQEIMNLLQPSVRSKLKARSLTNHSSATPLEHELYKCVELMEIETYTSPTTSDWMRISCPAIKMGPGESSRSHQADEYITVEEIGTGICGYINFISHLSELYS